MRFLSNLVFSALKTLVAWCVLTLIAYLGTYWLQSGIGLKEFLVAVGRVPLSDLYADALRDVLFWQVGLAVLACLALFDKCLLVVAAVLLLGDERATESVAVGSEPPP